MDKLHPLLYKDAIIDCLNNFKSLKNRKELVKSFFGMINDLDTLHHFTFDIDTQITMFQKAFGSDNELIHEITRNLLLAYGAYTHKDLNDTTITSLNFDCDKMMDATLCVDNCQKCCSQPAPTCIPTLDDNIVPKKIKRHDLITAACLKQEQENDASINKEKKLIKENEQHDSNDTAHIKQEQNNDASLPKKIKQHDPNSIDCIIQEHDGQEPSSHKLDINQTQDNQEPTSPKLNVNVNSMGVPFWTNSPPGPYDNSSDDGLLSPLSDWMRKNDPTSNQLIFLEALYCVTVITMHQYEYSGAKNLTLIERYFDMLQYIFELVKLDDAVEYLRTFDRLPWPHIAQLIKEKRNFIPVSWNTYFYILHFITLSPMKPRSP